MSFQHFRLGQLAMSQPLPPHLQQNQQQIYPQNNTSSSISSSILPPSATNQSLSPPKSTSSRPPYGSGDTDDGYTLIFPNIAAFQDWRNEEEETQMVEFVKGDTHGSKAVPPRFKDHTKLVCARHSRSGRKKYVKKHPERVRKVPSRKLEGQGCQASISYKTYFDTEEVRVCYIAEHSHAIGLANLPYTRRGRRATVQQEKEKSKRHSQAPTSADGEGSTTPKISQTPAPAPAPPQQMHAYNPPIAQLPHPFPPYQAAHPGAPPYQHMVAPPPGPPVQQEQWDRMSVLFNSIREHARAYEYPGASIVALESVLIRLYLESPMGGGGPGMGLGQLGLNMHGVTLPHGQQIQGQIQGQMPGHNQELHSHSPMNNPPANGEQANSEMDSGMESG
ncbi:hypothetical protein BJ138DRAFT_1123257 [Hygrophoropsis aurantiaca]|uniref:Uncharacterized protein n=1 Tax=Hygrophoropsis aurantiaca TaxID=72124 RepID=A0ACB8APA5_9AGAM|nr:hypothetical protein BJ138DRAFT_1123257 [Hygrophoropsis aurantiaca]